MKSVAHRIRSIAVLALVLAVPATSVAADTLDKVITSKTLRCGVQLDYRPAELRNQQN